MVRSFRSLRFTWSGIALWGILACACAQTGPSRVDAPVSDALRPTTAPSETTSAGVEDLPSAAQESIRPKPALDLSFEQVGPGPSLSSISFVAFRQAAVFASASAASSELLEVRVSPAGARRLWLKLDDYSPKPVFAPTSMRLETLLPELAELEVGHHRLLAFGGDRSDCSTLEVQGLSFSVGPPDALKSAAETLLVLPLLPHGTLNGEGAARSARLCFVANQVVPLQVSVRGPGGRFLDVRLAPGEYAVRGIVSGDYVFEWFAFEGGARRRLASVPLSVNLDAPISTTPKLDR